MPEDTEPAKGAGKASLVLPPPDPKRDAVTVEGRDVRRDLPAQPMEVKTGDRAFAVVPIGSSWQRVGWRAVRVQAVSTGGTAAVRTEEDRLIEGVPPALILPAPRERLRLGQVVRVGVGRGLPYGRVHRLEGGRVMVQTVYLGELREVAASPSEVLVVRQGPRPATPVVYGLAEGHRLGSLVAVDRKHRWVLGAEGVIHHLPWTDVTELDLDVPRRPGDVLRAAVTPDLRKVILMRELDKGLRYEVGWDGTASQVVCFSALAPP